MSALTSGEESGLRFRDVLRAELAPREGRWAAVTRVAIGCAVTVAIAMTFKIPQPTYMAYMVFLVSHDDRNATLITAAGGLAAGTLAILITLVFALVDFSEPGIRLPVMAALTFLAMYGTRTFALGPLTYLVGFVVVLLHSLIDEIPSPEAFTRATLWVWVIIAVPVTLTVALHIVFGHDVQVSARRMVRRVLGDLTGTLRQGDYLRWLPQWRGQLFPIWQALKHAKAPPAAPGQVGAEATGLVLETLTMLEVSPNPLSHSVRDRWLRQLEDCLRSLDGIEGSRLNSVSAPIGTSLDPPAENAVSRQFDVLHRLIAQGEVGALEPDDKEPRRPLFAADALSNPAHWQFALKTTIAVVASYAIYSLLDWPGMRTAIVTCFFVALTSLGETVHKLLLRLSGALIGGVLAGLSIVYVIPHLTDIGQLCALVGIVSLGAAWVATSSELLAYAGLQIAFAFFLGVLQSYAPANDLTVLRDRVFGILLGNIVITIVFSTLWPESAKTAVRAAAATLLRALAAVVRNGTRMMRMQAVEDLTNAEHYKTLSALELRMLSSREHPDIPVPPLVDLQRLTGAALVARAEAERGAQPDEVALRSAAWLEAAASCVASAERLPPKPTPSVARYPQGSPGEQPARRAMRQLETEIGHVAPALR
jgi:multidrug resistance protein MdtO